MENNEKTYDPELDLGAAVDERLQLGTTAGKISANRITLTTVIGLLIDKGLFTASEFVQKLEENQGNMVNNLQSAAKEYEGEDSKGLADLDRFMQAFNEHFEGYYKKFEEKNNILTVIDSE